jgi:hypothetical protein
MKKIKILGLIAAGIFSSVPVQEKDDPNFIRWESLMDRSRKLLKWPKK